MHVVGGGYIHGVDVLRFLFEQLTPVLIDPFLGEFLPRIRRAVEVHIADGDDLDAGAFGNLGKILPCHSASPEAGVAQDARR